MFIKRPDVVCTLQFVYYPRACEMIALTHKDECCKSSSSRVMMMSNDSYYSREGKTSD